MGSLPLVGSASCRVVGAATNDQNEQNESVIEYPAGEEPTPDPSEVEFIDGARERAARGDFPATINAAGGIYRRSVACADDRAVRYLWTADAPGDR